MPFRPRERPLDEGYTAMSKHRGDWRASVQILARDQRGAVMAIVGLAIIPLFAAIGLAIDGSRGYLAQSRLWSAVDAAALAGGRVYSSDTRDDDVNMYFETNFPDGFMGAVLEPLEIVPDDVNRTITVTARGTLPTSFMRVVGIPTMPISASSEVTIESQNVEVSLVLDVTGSMAGSRIVDLRDAANELVDIVVQDVQEPFYSKIALVPYSMAVNVGGYAAQVRGTYTNNVCQYPAAPTCRDYRFRRYSDNNWTTQRISTCVTERAGANAYTDAAPNVAPLGKNYPAPGTHNPCLANTIVPLTSNKDSLHDAIDVLQASGSTAGHIGVAWGWYMLAPSFAYLWPADSQPAAYDAEDLVKVAILMTDGEFNTVYRNGIVARDSGSGSGSDAYKINQNSSNGNANNQVLQLCTAMKTAGIVVYTVGLDIAGTATRDRLEECATEPDYAYFPEDGAELRQHFRAIAMKVSTLRLSK
jgi:Flp pilus assembly protein TadG